jgi:hypothetical protein
MYRSTRGCSTLTATGIHSPSRSREPLCTWGRHGWGNG